MPPIPNYGHRPVMPVKRMSKAILVLKENLVRIATILKLLENAVFMPSHSQMPPRLGMQHARTALPPETFVSGANVLLGWI